MLLSKNVTLIINKSNCKKYPNNKIGDVIDISVSDLDIKSSILVTVSCDICNNIKNIRYSVYMKYTNMLKNCYYCNKCNNIKRKKTIKERYGVENVSELNTVKEKRKKTFIERYGVENPSQSDDIKKKKISTLLEKYGVEHHFKLDRFVDKIKQTNIQKYGTEWSVQSIDIKNKTKITNLERYGVENPAQNEIIKQKIKKTFINNYGVENPNKDNNIRSKIENTNLLRYGNKHYMSSSFNKNKSIEYHKKLLSNDYEIVSYNDNLEIKHFKCNKIFNITIQNLYNRNISMKTEICTICNPVDKNVSGKEIILVNWLKELDVSIIECDRSIISPKELDIYIPNKRVAIEFNGLYWHSDIFKDKNYHLNKTLKCREKGIDLLHIFEDDLEYKEEIVKSIILNKIGMIKNNIYARCCEVKELNDNKIIRDFLNQNHIQGYTQSSIKLGLYKDDKLVSLMTFGYRYTNSKKEFELIRFCNILNTNVVGASSKLFKYFLSNYKYEKIISYSDLRLFNGGLYEKLGFVKTTLSKPDYFWVIDGVRKHRFNFNKQKLIKEGYDPNKTEVEIMHSRGYYRIYGCGQYRWVFNNP